MLWGKCAGKELSPVPFLIACVAIIYGVCIFSPDLMARDASSSSMQEQAIHVFLDVSRRYQEYIKTEVPFVNYVRDRKQAEVHIMMMRQETGSGGRKHTITFTGLQDFTAVNDTLVYTSRLMDTEDVVRSGIVGTIKMGNHLSGTHGFY